MLDEKQIKDKLIGKANSFRDYMDRGEYIKAKECYRTALTVAVFVKADNGTMEELFGIRGERGTVIKDGIFREDLVLKMFKKIDIKNEAPIKGPISVVLL